jgi:hypothetical protein
MSDVVDVIIPVDADAARELQTPARREALGRFVSGLLKGRGIADALAEAIKEAKHEAAARGLTNDDVDSEIEAWRAELQS